MSADSATQAEFRRLPSVDRLVEDDSLRSAREDYPRSIVVAAVREVLDSAREGVSAGGAAPTNSALVAAVQTRIAKIAGPSLMPVINATGVIVHTNLGRAPLSDETMAAMAGVSSGYSNVEYDLESGERGSRHTHLEDALRRLTGAEAALAVNNNAAAVLLSLAAIAQGREVVIARGQLVEIGGGFRIPEVMRQSGAHLVEVGTTNRTYVEDFAAAITPQTAALLRVHPSNFRVLGFAHDVSLQELVQVASLQKLPVLDDLGSGALLDTATCGLAHEPMPQESVASGADLVCFSGDKLLGGPQAGLVVGRKALVDRLKRHPLARAVRLDKASIAGLQATLLHYLRGEACAKIPVWRMITAPLAVIEGRAQALAARLREADIATAVVATESTVGGGALPGETLPSYALAVLGPESVPPGVVALPPQELAGRLRQQRPAVVVRIERGNLLLDMRTVFPAQDELLASALREVLAGACE